MSRVRGWREVAIRLTAAAIAAVLCLTLLAALGLGRAAASTASFDGEVALTTDAADSALFQAEGLAPGSPVANCVTVAYEGPDTPVEIHLHGASDGGPLDPYLRLHVEAGSGGGYDDCTGFTGTTAYTGTLAAFVTDHGVSAAALPITTLEPGAGPLTFRFSVEVVDDAAAQGASSLSSYTWSAVPATGPAPEPSPEPSPAPDPDQRQDPLEPAPPTDPTPVPDPTEPAPGTSLPTDPEPTDQEPATDPDPAEDADPDDAEPDAGNGVDDAGDDAPSSGHDGQEPGTAMPGTDHLDEAGASQWNWQRASEVAVFVAERSSYLLVLLLIVLAFLTVQDRIDRKDPKLAQAPREPDLDLHFEPPPSEGWGADER